MKSKEKMDPEMLAFLKKCGFKAKHYRSAFKDVKKDELTALLGKRNELQDKLYKLWPTTDQKKDQYILKVMLQLHEDKDEKEQQQIRDVKHEIKEEINSEDDEDEVSVVEEIDGDVSVVEVVTPCQSEVRRCKSEVIDIESVVEDNNHGLEEPPNGLETNSLDQSNSLDLLDISDSSSQGSSVATRLMYNNNVKRKSMDDDNDIDEDIPHVEGPTSPSIPPTSLNKRVRSVNEEETLVEESELFSPDLGPDKDWFWEATLGEIIIVSRSRLSQEAKTTSPKSPIQLSAIKSLKIDTGHIDFETQLEVIMRGASQSLQHIQFFFLDKTALKRFLDILTSISYYPCLNSLSIRKFDHEHILLKEEIQALSRIKISNLTELELEVGLWDDVKVPLENLLKDFSNLVRMKIHGCFVTDCKKDPYITIKFPKMDKLIELDLGGNTQMHSISETLELQKSSSQSLSGQSLEEDHSVRESFSVTVNLPTMPKLMRLVLGSFYKIEDLHFSKFPKLEVFRVSSKWNENVSWPKPGSRRFTYPAVKKIQLPDLLDDPKFVEVIPLHFPKLEKCYLSRPTIQVVRAFANHISKVKTFKRLDLKIQFHFPSSINAIFLNKPCTVPAFPEEIEKIHVLKEYTFWKEYVQENHVELPLTEFEDVGLEALRKKLKKFHLWHIPQTLRLPKGEYRWDADQRGFGDTWIGYKEYPFTQLAWSKCPSIGYGLKTFRFDMSNTTAAPMHFFEEAFPEYPTLKSSMESKKEEQSE